MLTDEQRKKLRSNPNFKSLSSGYKQEYAPAVENIDDKIASRQERAKAMVTPEQPKEEGVKGLAGGAVGVGKSLGGLAVGMSKLGQGLYDQTVGRLVPRAYKEATDKTLATAGEAMEAKGTAETVGKTVGDIAQFFIPGAVGLKAPKALGLLARAGLSGIETGIIASAQSGDIKEGAIAGLAGGALGAVGGVVSKTLKGLPKRLIQSAIKQKTAAIKAGQDVTDYVLKTKLPKTANALLDDSQTIISDLNNKISSNLKSVKITDVGGKISPKNIIDSVVNEYNAGGGATTAQEVKSVIYRLAPQVKGILSKPSMNFENANSLRSRLDRTLGDRAFFSQQNTGDKEILMNFANTLRETIKSKSPEGTRQLFSDLASEIRFSKALGDKVTKHQGNQIFSFGDIIGGGLGAFAGGPAGAIGVAITRRAIQSTPFLLGSAKVVDVINKAEPVIEKLSTAEQGILSELIQAIYDTSSDQSR